MTGRRRGRAWFALGLRLGLRELRRAPWRTALVVAMVLVPSAAMTAGVVIVRTGHWPAEEQRRERFGQADFVVTDLGQAGPTGGPQLDLTGLLADLPPGSTSAVVHESYERLAVGERRKTIVLTDLDLEDPMFDGRFRFREGRPPAAPREVVLTQETAEDLGAGVGGDVRALRLGGEQRVVGIVEPTARRDEIAFVAGGIEELRPSTVVWVDAPDDVNWIDAPGWDVQRLSPNADDTSAGLTLTYAFGLTGLIVMATVIAAAFAVGARRQLRSAGLLVAAGAPPVAVRWAFAAQGAWCGLLGGALGVVLGVAGAAAIPDRTLWSLAGHRVDGITVQPLDLLLVLAVAVGVSTVAALIPSRTVSRIPVLAALAGRRPLVPVAIRTPLLGLGAVGLGLLLIALAIAAGGGVAAVLVGLLGGLLLLGGALAIAPWCIGRLERGGDGRPGPWRLAGRGLARSRTRSTAVAGAIASVVVGLVTVATLTLPQGDRCCAAGGGLEQQAADQVVLSGGVASLGPESAPSVDVTAVPAEDLRRVQALLPGSRLVSYEPLGPAPTRSGVGVLRISLPGDSRYDVRVAALATPELLDALGVSTTDRAALDQVGALVLGEPGPRPVPIEVTVLADAAAVESSRTIDAQPVRGTVRPSQAVPTVLLSPGAFDRLGLVEQPEVRSVVVADRPITAAQRQALLTLAGDLQAESDRGVDSWQTTYLGLPKERGFHLTEVQQRVAGLAAGLVVVLLVVAIALALAAADAAEEAGVLRAVGASPRLLRRTSGARAALLVAVGSWVAVPIAIPLGVLLARATDLDPTDGRSGRPDWVAVAFALVVLPAAAWLATVGGAWLRDRVRAPRPDVVALGD